MGDRARRFDEHRIRSTDLYANPARFGFEPCGCGAHSFDRDCPRCDGLGLVRIVQQCNGCGHCCLAMTCATAQVFRFAARDQRCPYLFWDGGCYRCGLSGTTDEDIRDGLAHGEGCCQPLNSWRKDVRFRG
jgi:hypothetical protein